MRILCIGEDAPPGSGIYLLGVLKTLQVKVAHVSSKARVPERLLRRHFNSIIFSDYPRSNLSASVEQAIVNQIRAGSGLLMIGGWGSFSGPFGRWKGSLIEELLPVRCQGKDDRRNLSGNNILHQLQDVWNHNQQCTTRFQEFPPIG